MSCVAGQDVQLKYFARQFELAKEFNLPMFLHSRNAGADFADMMKRHADCVKVAPLSTPQTPPALCRRPHARMHAQRSRGGLSPL